MRSDIGGLPEVVPLRAGFVVSEAYGAFEAVLRVARGTAFVFSALGTFQIIPALLGDPFAGVDQVSGVELPNGDQEGTAGARADVQLDRQVRVSTDKGRRGSDHNAPHYPRSSRGCWTVRRGPAYGVGVP
ncbi:MAG: hypothetical protein ABR585_07540 [Gemmatimonadaceae bacterium]